MRLKALVILLEDVDNKLKIYRLQLVLPHELLLAILTPESLFDLESAFDPEGAEDPEGAADSEGTADPDGVAGKGAGPGSKGVADPDCPACERDVD